MTKQPHESDDERKKFAQNQRRQERSSSNYIQRFVTSAFHSFLDVFIYCPFRIRARKNRDERKNGGMKRREEEREACVRHQRKRVDSGS